MYTDNNDNKIQALDAALNSWIQEKSKSDFALDVLCMFHAMRMVSSDRSWSLGRRSWRGSCGMEDPHLEATLNGWVVLGTSTGHHGVQMFFNALFIIKYRVLLQIYHQNPSNDTGTVTSESLHKGITISLGLRRRARGGDKIVKHMQRDWNMMEKMKNKLKTFYFMIFEFKDPVVYNCSFMFHPREHNNASKAWPLANIHWWKEALDTVGFRLGWRCLMVWHMAIWLLLQMIQPDSPLRLEIYWNISW